MTHDEQTHPCVERIKARRLARIASFVSAMVAAGALSTILSAQFTPLIFDHIVSTSVAGALATIAFVAVIAWSLHRDSDADPEPEDEARPEPEQRRRAA